MLEIIYNKITLAPRGDHRKTYKKQHKKICTIWSFDLYVDHMGNCFGSWPSSSTQSRPLNLSCSQSSTTPVPSNLYANPDPPSLARGPTAKMIIQKCRPTILRDTNGMILMIIRKVMHVDHAYGNVVDITYYHRSYIHSFMVLRLWDFFPFFLIHFSLWQNIYWKKKKTWSLYCTV